MAATTTTKIATTMLVQRAADPTDHLFCMSTGRPVSRNGPPTRSWGGAHIKTGAPTLSAPGVRAPTVRRWPDRYNYQYPGNPQSSYWLKYKIIWNQQNFDGLTHESGPRVLMSEVDSHCKRCRCGARPLDRSICMDASNK